MHDWRVRKTGPCIALAVARCRTHAVAFTLYPPGYVPYGRVRVMPVDLAGRAVWTPSGSRSWAGTLWEAASDAADAKRWPKEGTEPTSRRTQGRRLEQASTLLGLSLWLDASMRERLGAALDVPTLTLVKVCKTSLHAGGSWTERGAMIVAVLERVREPRRLLAAGHVVGLWGPASRWDPVGQALRRSF